MSVGLSNPKIAACTCVWATKKLPVDVATKHISKAGYRGIVPFWPMISSYAGSNPSKFRDLVEENNLEVPVVLLLHDSLTNHKKAVDFLVKSGTAPVFSWVTSKKSGKGNGEDIENEVRIVKDLLNYVSRRGKRLAIHTHVGGFVLQEREKIDQFFERINDERLLLTFDCAQIAAAGEIDLPGMIKTYQDRLFDVHFKDISHYGPWGDEFDAKKDFLDVGEGVIDWHGVIEALKETNFQHWLVSDNDFADDPLHYAEKTYRKIKGLWEKKAR